MGSSGFIKQIKEEGSGEPPQQGQTVRVHYTGQLANGQVFDSSHNRGIPLEFELGAGRVIRGWDEGIATMRPGEKARLTISPEYGYGRHGAGSSIPPNAFLIFDVELVEESKESE